MNALSARQAVGRLRSIRCNFGAKYASEKLNLLETLSVRPVLAAADIKRLHSSLCFMRAFPDTREVHSKASSLLADFQDRVAKLGNFQRTRLDESGIAGTKLHYPFSYDVACWIARIFPGVATIDWNEFPDSARLDELLEQLLEHSEVDYFHSGDVSTREWLDVAATNYAGSTFDWLMAQLAERPQYERFWRAIYNTIDLPLSCALQNNLFSRTGNALPITGVYCRNENMRSRVSRAKREIASPIRKIRRVSSGEGRRIVDVARGSLALRHRETDHFNNANAAEVYLADVGKGARIALIGQLADRRDPLECTLGYLILSNGAPVGYGGASVLFHQANTGINIFDEYRGSEAAWFWTQVMRALHSLTGCSRFIANPYQLGEENSEALKSGAFWFYYRLGYRPVDADVQRLARQEFRKIGRRKGYRSSVATLKQLAACDMHLVLPGARQADIFDERWIDLSSLLASKALANAKQPSRNEALEFVVRQVMRGLGVRGMNGWPKPQQQSFVRMCPIIAAIDFTGWTKSEKKDLLQLMRAKGGKMEVDYARRLRNHNPLFRELKKHCKKVA